MRLALYLSRALAGRILGATAVLLALGLSLDLIRAADELVEIGGAAAMLRYAALRAPAMAAQVLPLGTLIGGLLAFLALGRRSELTVIRAAGQSVFRMLVKLAPLALVLGLVQHLLVDEGTSWSERALGRAFPGIAETPAPAPGKRLAGRVGDAVVIGRLADRDGVEIAPLTVYALDAEGQVTGRVEASRALHIDIGWRLEGARRIGETPEGPAPDLLWPTALDPETVRALASGEVSSTAREAASALAGTTVATRSTAYYETRLARAVSAAVIPAMMLLCAAFASFKTARGPGGLGIVAFGAALGLAFIAVDGLFNSFGKVGLIPAWAAAWVPAGVFGLTALWALLLREE